MKPIKKYGLLLGAAVGLGTVAFVALSIVLDEWGKVDRAQKSDAILIFGARVGPNEQPSSLLRARTRHAFELWQRGLAPKIVCTGGVGDYPPAESVAESRLLKEWGVPEGAILREEKSTSTRENALFASQLLPKGASVIAVSDPFHLWRARRDCQRAGLTATTSPELDGWAQLPRWSRAFYCLRESLLVLRDSIFG